MTFDLPPITIPEGADTPPTDEVDIDTLFGRDPRETTLEQRRLIVEKLRAQRSQWLQAEAAGKKTSTRKRKAKDKIETKELPSSDPGVDVEDRQLSIESLVSEGGADGGDLPASPSLEDLSLI